MIIRPAEVKVTILEPIETSDWTLRNVAPQTRRIHRLFLEALDQLDEPGQADTE